MEAGSWKQAGSRELGASWVGPWKLDDGCPSAACEKGPGAQGSFGNGWGVAQVGSWGVGVLGPGARGCGEMPSRVETGLACIA